MIHLCGNIGGMRYNWGVIRKAIICIIFYLLGFESMFPELGIV